jgi:esterase/lipase superfamily enzyme
MRKLSFAVVAAIILIMVIGWAALQQSTVYLMPTPAVITAGELNPFDMGPDTENDNRIRILYATNRIPAGIKENRTYTIFPGNQLGLGTIDMQIGGEGTTWQQILYWSTSTNLENRPAMYLTRLKEMAQFPLDEIQNRPGSAQEFYSMVNRILDQSADKDIMIYVHGANTNIYRASAQAAQYQHFTGQNSLVLVFLWPSAENLLAYGTDRRHAEKSGPAFARLLGLLTQHTNVRRINILAYSAGAQILGPALDIIGRNTAIDNRKEPRVGEVYFAASDIGVGVFVDYLQTYIDIPEHISLSFNRRDSVLAWSARRNQTSLVGRPDISDLNQAQYEWLRKASNGSALSIIEVSAETVTGMSSRSHDFWYSHPWVSSDILTQFLFQAGPRSRGLIESKTDDNLRYWTFPPDYPERILGIAKQTREVMRQPSP